MKKYSVGFYGGKFMPFHLGHELCLKRMAEECELGYLIIFANGNDEERILAENNEEYLTLEARWKQVFELASEYTNIIPCIIDCADCKFPDGTEDWDAETPLVRMACGDKIDAVYGSEYSYAPYFERAYPEAEYVLVDPPRVIYPISGTMCRDMTKEERTEWLV